MGIKNDNRRFLTMVQTLSLRTLLVIVLLSFGKLCYAGNKKIVIGIIGDQTGCSNITNAYTTLESGINILHNYNVDLALHIGDIVESSYSDDSIIYCFKKATDIINKIKIPWYLTPGDHDVNPSKFEPGSQDHSKETLFRKLLAGKNQQIEKNLYYSFDFRGYHFISLYSIETFHVDPRWGNIFMAKISESQLQWLKNDLESHKKSKGIIVFTHQPLWYNWSAWLKVHHLLKQYGVLAAIAGHFHYTQDEGELDGIRYFVTGVTGGNVRDSNANVANVSNVTVLTIKNKKIAINVIPLNSQKQMKLTNRLDMDRVQAIETMLDDLWAFGQRNPIYLKDTNLVCDCKSKDTAKLSLREIGNPIDVPIEVKLVFNSKNLKLSSAKFLPDICMSCKDSFECILQPGKRISSSNLSSVSTTYDCSVPSSMWTAKPIVADSLPKFGEKLNLTIRITFQGETENYIMERDVYSIVNKCTE